MQADTLSGGFANLAIDSAHAFRSLMEAMARPGTLQNIGGAESPAPLSAAAGAVLLTLCDTETPVHLAGATDCESVRRWLAFHTGAPITPRAQAMFALGDWDALLPLSDYPIGASDYPDRSATLIVECESINHSGAYLEGPGIKTRASLSLPETAAFQANRALFPQGLDFIFTCGDQLAALPRTTRVAKQGAA